MLLSIGSFGRLVQALRGNPDRFATVYTLGNILSLASMFFLAGPERQWRRMTDKRRRICALAYVVSIVLTVLLLYMGWMFHGRGLLIILLVIVQWCAMIWYVLSYLPFGHRMASGALSGCYNWCFGSE